MNAITLGTLEKQIMDILWEKKQCSVRDVLTELEKEKKLAYTTVSTILVRLYDKGLVLKKANKHGLIYSPKVTKEHFSKKIANSFIKKFIASYGDTAIASFAESVDNLPEKKRKYFLDMLEAYGKGK